VYEKEKYVFSAKPLFDQKPKNTILEVCWKIIRNNIKVGDAITVLPSLTESKVSIYTFFDKQFEASVGSSITIELENDINVTRGDMIVKSSEFKVEKDINTTVCWMDSKSGSRCKIFCTTQHEPSFS
jgi:sulfate adenylyltransferase subunit 1